ncbi:hypothetical protein [uncultured Gilvimarinus sp.]|uniref:hypothetical protein n=1 Tax=uncultured Gilvimarinus sp. TaxID=1689143 RepID=UPI0030DCBB65
MTLKTFLTPALIALLAITHSASAADIQPLQINWAAIQYQMPEEKREDALKALAENAEQLANENQNCAPCWIWAGIIRSSYAGAKGGLGALGEVKAARKHLERAIDIDPGALDGSAYASLGTLYYKVPGWPLGFGDDDKAELMLTKALQYNPNGIDPNYFWGDYLIEQKRYPEALEALKKASNAPGRPDRPAADAGRRKEVQAAILRAENALK